MINNAITTTKGMEQAQKQMEQAKNRMALEKKANEERRKFENHHKYMMGGAGHKYFKECFRFEESEINEILEVAFKTRDLPHDKGCAIRSAMLRFSPIKEVVRK